MFIVEDNILWHLDGPSDHTGSHENWFQGYKTDLISHPKLAMALVNLRFSLFFYILLIFMNMKMR